MHLFGEYKHYMRTIWFHLPEHTNFIPLKTLLDLVNNRKI